jgi:glycosyltransferase involved in cell wall biosynthesis
MKIAQVAPLYESVPPKLYGGTERIVSYLTEELVRQGHHVTLFASGDSETAAELVPICETSLRLDESVIDQVAHHILMLEKIVQRADEFDIIHFHVDYLHFPLSRTYGYSQVTTLHGRLDLPDLAALYQEFDDMPVISISDSQRKPLSHANWLATVYHGLPVDLLTSLESGGEYLAFLGRISPEKRVDRAIEVALRLGVPLEIAAKVDRADYEYYNDEIKHLMIDQPLVKFIGEIGQKEKSQFLGNAKALVFPIDWQEPFGLVMIEAMACGTPVVAFGLGSVPEVIDDGVTGFIVETIEDAVEAVEKIDDLDRTRVREVFEERFSAERMAHDYLSAYQQVIGQHKG